jgi:NhaA family Na+:H+ antiporter
VNRSDRPIADVDAPIVNRILRPFQQFVATETAGGVVLFVFTVLALGWANSPAGDAYFAFWERSASIGIDELVMTKTLHHWINDGLMVVFFLMVGLEIKREVFVGELSSLKQAALPIAAAVGGMLVPAGIYAALNGGGPGARGWGIPMATDIAFALGVLALLGDRIPAGVRVFLAALAIVDDIGAVLVIAVFYTPSLSMSALGVAAAIFVVLLVCNRIGVRHPGVYAMLGIGLWMAILDSGIHATIAGVLLAATIPSRTRIDEDTFANRAELAILDFRNASSPTSRTVLSNPAQQEALHDLERAIDQVQSPLLRVEHALHRVVAFVIMPLFAFANAGVRLSAETFGNLTWHVVVGVAVGLVVGKMVGITLASWGSVRMRIAALPNQATWPAVWGVSWLGGIGFTMSLFVATLAFGAGPLLDSAKIGILAGSICAGTVGTIVLRVTARPRAVGAIARA